ncbi:MAG: hypothetical protein ABW184_09920 [Sphingobium sp.]
MSPLGHLIACAKAARLGLKPPTLAEWQALECEQAFEGVVLDHLTTAISQFYGIPWDEVFGHVICRPDEFRTLPIMPDGWVVIAGFVTGKFKVDGPPLPVTIH